MAAMAMNFVHKPGKSSANLLRKTANIGGGRGCLFEGMNAREAWLLANLQCDCALRAANHLQKARELFSDQAFGKEENRAVKILASEAHFS